MFKIIFTKTALDNLIEIRDYIALNNVEIAQKVFDIIFNLASYLSIFPKLWIEINWANYREIVEPIYNYKIRYKIDWDVIYSLVIYKYNNL